MIKETDHKPNGLYATDNHILLEWSDGERQVYFSAAQQGQAMTVHIAAKGKNKLALREAVEDFIDYIFTNYTWCDVVIGAITKPSVVNLANKCGFHHIGDALIGEDAQEGRIMARFR